ncbi:hypothetical protein [Erythrobacter sp. SG61-1L]|uniref:hypothetical protein n=1 Tax=Erythrobacter sp. SG61-1L TaxID=1603897 RepID=UPI0012E1BA50|nr:hypothetical protein [Erythrobacter sp. SG61-1L]
MIIAAMLLLAACGSGAPEIPQEPTATAKDDAVSFVKRFQAVVAPCDAAGKVVSSVNDMVSMYRAADHMEAACLEVPGKIRELEVPVSLGKDAHAQFTKAVEDCDNAYLARWSAARAMKEAVEHSDSIAAQADLADATEGLQAAILICGAGLAGGAMSVGASEADLGLKDQ